MQDPVAFAQALADATRWNIVRLIFADALCVCELADILQLPQSTLSSHLQVIRKSGLVVSERCEKWIYYKIATAHRPLLTPLFRQFGGLPAALAKRKTVRLAQREDCDCPGPQRLPKLARRRSTAKSL